MTQVLVAAAVVLALSGAAIAETAADSAGKPQPGTSTGTTGEGTAGSPGSDTAMAPGKDAAKGAAATDDNSAVKLGDDQATPAKGANSFTPAQALSRISDRGFTDVAGLQQDSNGIWRGKAMRDGRQVNVWLDYKGNVGQQ